MADETKQAKGTFPNNVVADPKKRQGMKLSEFKNVPLVWLALFFSLIFSGVLFFTNVRLQREIRRLQAASDRQALERAPLYGTYLPNIEGIDRSGAPKHIDFVGNHGGALVVVFSPVCGYCKLEISLWSSILRSHPNARWVFVDVTNIDDSAFLSELNLAPNIERISISKEEAAKHHLLVTPTLIATDKTGMVTWSWSGLLPDDQALILSRLMNRL